MDRGTPDRILVIKLSALGDFVVSLGAMQAIRRHHRDARITLLTTRAYAGLAEASGCFDQVWVDRRSPFWQVTSWLALARRLRGAGFDRVYDLQRSQRTGWYFRLFGHRKPEWIGIAPGASHRYLDPPRPTHIADRHAAMLALAGIEAVRPPDLAFLSAEVTRFGIGRPYALVAPGSSAHLPGKRWPSTRYAAVARWLTDRAIAPVLICGPAEQDVAEAIVQACPETHNPETNLNDIVELARGALCALGNDTGPMHLVAAANCPSLILFSGKTDPRLTSPRGAKVSTLREEFLSRLPVEAVLASLETLMGAPGSARSGATGLWPPPGPRQPAGRP